MQYVLGRESSFSYAIGSMIKSLPSNIIIRSYINTQEYIEQGIENHCVQYPLNNGLIERLGDYVE